MSFDAGSISGKIGLDINPYTQGMLQATSIAQLFPQTVTNFLANPLLGIVGVAKSVTSSLSAMFSNATKYADDMGDLAEQVGVTVENLTALGQVASMSGGSVEMVSDAFRFLGKNVSEAMANAESAAGKTFAKLGVAFTDARGDSRALEAIMLDLADAFERLPAGAERTAVAMELLGRSGTGMVPTLAQGSAALREQMERMKEYGAAVSQSSRESSDAWNDAMGEMSLAWQGLQQTAAEPIRDALLPYLNAALDWVRENMPTIRETIREAMQSAKQYFEEFGPVAVQISKVVIAAIREVGEFLQSSWQVWKTTMAAVMAFSMDPTGFLKDPGGRTRGAIAAIDMGFRAMGNETRSIVTDQQKKDAAQSQQEIYDAARRSTDERTSQLGGQVGRGIFNGGGNVNVNVPGIDTQDLANAISNRVQPQIDQRVREAEAAAEAAGRRKRVKEGFR
jgi:hypothetical protein